MKILSVIIVLTSSVMTPVCADPPDQLVVENKGTVRMNVLMGSVSWTGTILLKHRGRLMNVEGQATLFAGPSVQLKSGSGTKLSKAKFTIEQECISLIALGDITITSRDGRLINAKHVVYLLKDDRILADGVALTERQK